MDSLNASGGERRRTLAFEDILLFRIASVSMSGETGDGVDIYVQQPHQAHGRYLQVHCSQLHKWKTLNSRQNSFKPLKGN